MSSLTDSTPVAPSTPLNGLQIALKTASALATLFPAVSLASVPLSMLADHEPALADALTGYFSLQHVTLADLIAAETAAIMSADPLKDTAD